ncbi:MAG: hypothetical protein KDA61_16620, partial [Planctomycetales bacterium]|nr:hypothetical protein [Planctomycetales bacterium]
MRSRLVISTAAALLLVAAAKPLSAEQLTLKVDRQTGSLTLTSDGAGAATFAAYEIRSQRSTI